LPAFFFFLEAAIDCASFEAYTRQLKDAEGGEAKAAGSDPTRIGPASRQPCQNALCIFTFESAILYFGWKLYFKLRFFIRFDLPGNSNSLLSSNKYNQGNPSKSNIFDLGINS